MSHFNVWVIGEDVDGQLEKYDENGNFIFTNVTEEAKEDFKNTGLEGIAGPDGKAYHINNRKFWKWMTLEEQQMVAEEKGLKVGWELQGEGFSHKGNFYYRKFPKETMYKKMVLPEGYERKVVPATKLYSFRTYLTEYYGYEVVAEGDSAPSNHSYVILDNKKRVVAVMECNNPNAKWDWYQVGGRWGRSLRINNTANLLDFYPKQEGYISNPQPIASLTDSHEVLINGEFVKAGDVKIGDRIRGGDGKEYEVSAITPFGVDSAEKCRIDIERMKAEPMVRASRFYTKVRKVIDPHLDTYRPLSYFEDYEGKISPEHRKEYNEQPLVKGLYEAFGDEAHFININRFLVSKEEYLKDYEQDWLPFAVVKDGKWYQKGQMGWWATVTDEMKSTDWESIVLRILEETPATETITVVDCHI